jgi:hypothetical protein
MRVLYSFFCARVCCTTNAPKMTHLPFLLSSPHSFILLPITSRPFFKLEPLRCVFPFVTAASIHDRLFPFYLKKMCDGEKKAKQWQQVCVLLLLCGKRGTACGFLKCWVCVCRNTQQLKWGPGEVCSTCRSCYENITGKESLPTIQ